MEIKRLTTSLAFYAAFAVSGCSDAFLEKKPSSEILLPNTLEDIAGLLENTAVLQYTPGLPQMSADEYFIVGEDAFHSLVDPITRNAYIWQVDLYEGKESIQDWNIPYTQVFYANSVLELLAENKENDRDRIGFLTGWALFVRAHAFYSLAQNFCGLYDPATAMSQNGIPLRLRADADMVVPRSTLEETFQRIFEDLHTAVGKLPDQVSQLYRNHPSKAAVHALLTRIYLNHGDYAKAESHADTTLALYDRLVDYNGISTTSATPFANALDEVLYYTTQITSYNQTTGYNSQLAFGVDESLIAEYGANDLRLNIFFLKNTLGNYNVKRGYVNAGAYPFTGLATDEVYLAKAECLARRGETDTSMDVLNLLLEKRHSSGSHVPKTATSKEDALATILTERRKELVWRGLRWQDLKRFNKEGTGVALERNMDGNNYHLPPNGPRYVFPIPNDEIALSGIEQNQR